MASSSCADPRGVDIRTSRRCRVRSSSPPACTHALTHAARTLRRTASEQTRKVFARPSLRSPSLSLSFASGHRLFLCCRRTNQWSLWLFFILYSLYSPGETGEGGRRRRRRRRSSTGISSRGLGLVFLFFFRGEDFLGCLGRGLLANSKWRLLRIILGFILVFGIFLGELFRVFWVGILR